MSDRDPGELDVAPARPGRGALSLIWLVPLAAIAISLAMAWQAFSDRGPLIVIDFENAEGIVAGATELKFRNVSVGVVEDVYFANQLQRVRVEVRVDKQYAAYIDEEAQFWVVRPEISAQGISGLGTLLGGVFLEGSWDAEPGAPLPEEAYEGLDAPPFINDAADGVRFRLAAPTAGTIEPGAPIIYKGVTVGQIDRPEIDRANNTVTAEAFVGGANADLITDTTRFWAVSGISFAFGLDGVSVDIANLSALVQGGVAFDTFGEGGNPVTEDHTFTVYASREEAGSLVMADLSGPEAPFSVLFDGSMQGLRAGAPVIYDGIIVGSVAGTGATIEDAPDGPRVRPRADITLAPERFGILEGDVIVRTESLLAALVAQGYRARVESTGLLGTGRALALALVDDPPPAVLSQSEGGRPIIPATAAEVEDTAATARSAFSRIEDIPVDEIATAVTELLERVSDVVGSPDVQAAPRELVGLVADLRMLLGGPEIRDAIGEGASAIARLDAILAQVEESEAALRLGAAIESAAEVAADIAEVSDRAPLILARVETLLDELAALDVAAVGAAAASAAQGAADVLTDPALSGLPAELAALLETGRGAAADLGAVTSRLRDSAAIPEVLAALERTDRVAAAVEASLADVPVLLEALQGLVEDARALPLAQLGEEAAAFAAAAGDIVASPQAQALPAEVAAAVAALGEAADNLAALSATLRAGEGVAALEAALRRTDTIAASVEASAKALPGLLAEIEGATADARALPLDSLINSAADTAGALEAILGTPEAQALPGELSAALAEAATASSQLGEIAATLRQSGALTTLTDALNRTDRITADVEAAADGLPALMERIDAVAAQAEAVPLADLADAARDLVATADALLASEDVAEIPPALAAALEQVSLALAELREGGAAENTAATLASAREAADAVAAAAEALPGLAADLDALVARTDATLATYGGRSEFNAQTLGALQDLRETARAVTSLARTIERKPNALLIGR